MNTPENQPENRLKNELQRIKRAGVGARNYATSWRKPTEQEIEQVLNSEETARAQRNFRHVEPSANDNDLRTLQYDENADLDDIRANIGTIRELNNQALLIPNPKDRAIIDNLDSSLFNFSSPDIIRKNGALIRDLITVFQSDPDTLYRVNLYKPGFFDRIMSRYEQGLSYAQRSGNLDAFLDNLTVLVDHVKTLEGKRFVVSLCIITIRFINRKLLDPNVPDEWKIDCFSLYSEALMPLKQALSPRFMSSLKRNIGEDFLGLLKRKVGQDEVQYIDDFLNNEIPQVVVVKDRKVRRVFVYLPISGSSRSMELQFTKKEGRISREIEDYEKLINFLRKKKFITWEFKRTQGVHDYIKPNDQERYWRSDANIAVSQQRAQETMSAAPTQAQSAQNEFSGVPPSFQSDIEASEPDFMDRIDGPDAQTSQPEDLQDTRPISQATRPITAAADDTQPTPAYPTPIPRTIEDAVEDVLNEAEIFGGNSAQQSGPPPSENFEFEDPSVDNTAPNLAAAQPNDDQLDASALFTDDSEDELPTPDQVNTPFETAEYKIAGIIDEFEEKHGALPEKSEFEKIGEELLVRVPDPKYVLTLNGEPFNKIQHIILDPRGFVKELVFLNNEDIITLPAINVPVLKNVSSFLLEGQEDFKGIEYREILPTKFLEGMELIGAEKGSYKLSEPKDGTIRLTSNSTFVIGIGRPMSLGTNPYARDLNYMEFDEKTGIVKFEIKDQRGIRFRDPSSNDGQILNARVIEIHPEDGEIVSLDGEPYIKKLPPRPPTPPTQQQPIISNDVTDSQPNSLNNEPEIPNNPNTIENEDESLENSFRTLSARLQSILSDKDFYNFIRFNNTAARSGDLLTIKLKNLMPYLDRISKYFNVGEDFSKDRLTTVFLLLFRDLKFFLDSIDPSKLSQRDVASYRTYLSTLGEALSRIPIKFTSNKSVNSLIKSLVEMQLYIKDLEFKSNVRRTA